MRASLLALMLLAACGGSDAEGGLNEDEAERLNEAGEMLEKPGSGFEEREVDVGPADEDDPTERTEAAEDEAAED